MNSCAGGGWFGPLTLTVRPRDPLMPVVTIQPLVGVGLVRFGMSPEEVRLVMPEPPRSFRKRRTSRYKTDAFFHDAFQVSYDGDLPTVEFIELQGHSAVRPFYRHVHVLATPADEVVAFISRDATFDANDPEFPSTYTFRDLQLSFWRPIIPESADDEIGRCFSTVGIGRRGYYDSV